jgi:hypothetical protein
MSELENHWNEVSRIETELLRKMTVLGLDWHDDAAMAQLASECKAFHPADANAAYASHDYQKIAKAELFGLASLMLRAMENAALEGRDVHGGEVWKSFGKHLYSSPRP